MTFGYHDYIPWLPATLDRNTTWHTFFNLLALASSFWAARDWLQAHPESSLSDVPAISRSSVLLSSRLKSLLWVLTLSGGLLSFEGVVQRLSGSVKLLFLAIPDIHKEVQEQFASYAYRANAGQYFNLVWPVSLGFWWMTRLRAVRGITSHLLLGCAMIMAACPIISSARGATLLDVALLFMTMTTLLLWLTFGPAINRSSGSRSVALLLLFFTGALGVGLIMGWTHFPVQLDSLAFGLAEREKLYQCAERIAADYPFFGTGPGSFEKVFQLYRSSLDGYWPAQLHNDWLETRVTWGWVGSGLIGVAMLIVALILIKRVSAGRATALDFFLVLSLFGCLVQARWDFPLQIYSIMFLFVVWCSMLVVPARP